MNLQKIKIFALGLLMSTITNAVVQTGAPAPNFTLPASDGKTYQLNQFKGKIVVLEWLNHGCPFVKKHYDKRHNNMQNLQKKYTDKGVVWLSIISSAEGNQGYSTPQKAKSDRKEKGAHPTAILLDTKGEIGQMYGAKTTPHMFVIDPKGKIIYQGAIDDQPSTDIDDIPSAKNYVAKALNWTMAEPQKLAQKAFSPGKIKPYGCSVKY